MKKTIAIAFSDLHINLWAKYNEKNRRTLNGFDVLFRIANICHHKRCPALFCGDMFHKPENIDEELFDIIIDQFDRVSRDYPDFKVYAISGNHELNKINTVKNPQKSWVLRWARFYAWIKCIDFKTVKIKGFNVHGIPYLDHNTGLSEYLRTLNTDILLLHSDFPGAQDTDGRAIDSTENLNINMLKPFKLILMGHIHKPQRLGKKVYMVGAPQQQRRTDRNCRMGYLEIYDDLTCKFKYWDDYPKFIDVESDEDIKDDGNYYTVIPKTSRIERVTNNKITKQLSKKRLAKLYMKQKGNKNKSQLKLLTRILNKSEEQC